MVGRFRLFWWAVARGVLAFVLLVALGLAAVGVISVIGLPLVLIGLVVLRPLADLAVRGVDLVVRPGTQRDSGGGDLDADADLRQEFRVTPGVRR